VSIVGPLAASVTLPYHMVYLALAIGCGSKPLPWMNDSGFWITSKMSGLSEAETLKTYTVVITLMGFVCMGATLLGARYLPFVETGG
jgi:GntP family gluconate:H+ symporter